MFTEITSLWIIVGTIVVSATISTLVIIIIFSNNRDLAAREREQRIQNEKKEIEYRFQQARRIAIMGSLAGGMSYYFSNIMLAISSLLDIMKLEKSDPQTIDHFATLITDEVKRGLNVSEQLQQMAHPEHMEMGPISVSEIVAEVPGLLDKTSIDFSVEFPDGHPTVLGDRTLLSQMMVNLATNAKDAMPEGGSLSISASQVRSKELEFSPEAPGVDEYLKLTVADTGMGMPDESQARAFEPFFTTKNRLDRLGLGLSFVYGIVRIHNGRVEIESKGNEGTTITLYLPATSPDQSRPDMNETTRSEIKSVESMTQQERAFITKEIVGRT